MCCVQFLKQVLSSALSPMQLSESDFGKHSLSLVRMPYSPQPDAIQSLQLLHSPQLGTAAKCGKFNGFTSVQVK